LAVLERAADGGYGIFYLFLTTFVSIIALLVWNQIGGHTVDYADTYRYVGFPAGVRRWWWRLLCLGAVGAGKVAQLGMALNRVIGISGDVSV